MATLHEFTGLTDLDRCADLIMDGLLDLGMDDAAVSADLNERTIEIEVFVDFSDPVAGFGQARRQILEAINVAGVCITELNNDESSDPMVEPDWAITPQRSGDLLPA